MKRGDRQRSDRCRRSPGWKSRKTHRRNHLRNRDSLENDPLSDGSALQLAILEWLTPKGRTIWHKGISPDIAVSLPTDASALLPEAERNLSSEELRASKDRQLLRAIEFMQEKQPQ